jgi:hypothetical protein
MLNQKESTAVLKNYFKKKKFATMKDLIHLLKTTNSMSVYRRLKNLNYLSSFSDAGKYYTLKNVADFDSSGLWFVDEIGFSYYGNLKQTLVHLIEQSNAGKTYQELERQLKTNLGNALHNSLLNLVKANKISRTTLSSSHVYLYASANSAKAKKQMICRNAFQVTWKETEYPDYIIIEILASIIKTTRGIQIDLSKIVLDLKVKKIIITEDQVEHILNKLNLKKTLDSL